MIKMVDVMALLAEHGWTSYRLRKERVLSEGTLTRLRNGQPITTTTIDKLCELCGCQPQDLISYIPDEQGD